MRDYNHCSIIGVEVDFQSQPIVSISKLFVGSSKNKISGFGYKTCAKKVF